MKPPSMVAVAAPRLIKSLLFILAINALLFNLEWFESTEQSAQPRRWMSPHGELSMHINHLTSTSSSVTAKFVTVYSIADDIPMFGQVKFTFANNVEHAFHAPVVSSSNGSTSWDPIGGSQKTFSGQFIETNVSWAYSNSSNKTAEVVLQFQLYDHMLATRVIYGAENSGKFDTLFNYANFDHHLDATVYADHGDEIGVYKTDGDHPLQEVGKVHQVPVSIDLKQNDRSNSRLTTWFSEACTFDTVNSRISGTLNTRQGLDAHFQDLQSGGDARSPFFVWQFGGSMIELANHGESAGMLCDEPPEGRATFDWVKAGKQVRVPGLRHIVSKSDIEMNVHKTAALCEKHDICQYLLYDAGWYGDETNYTSDPMKPVPGFDLDAIASIGKKYGVDTIVYINQHALTNTTRVEKLAKYLVNASVAGVKMGFMTVTSTPSLREVIEYVRIFGRHKLVVNIHDNVCGFGIQRTFPNLLSVEGVAGDEHNDKDYTERALIIPFTRAEAGRMDYTFVINEAQLATLRLSPLAQVAKSVILGVNGLWTIYWYAGWGAIAKVALDNESPYSLWNEMSNHWTASVFLDSTPGDFVSVARQLSSTGVWYIVAVGRVAHTFTWPLSSLLSKNEERNFEVQRWTENGKSADADVVNVNSTLMCTATDDVISGLHSGCILRLTPVKNFNIRSIDQQNKAVNPCQVDLHQATLE